MPVPRLRRGDPAPPLVLPDHLGRQRDLDGLRAGGRILVYFFPEAGTPDCTEQACVVRDARTELAQLDTAVAGVSPDPPDTLRDFREAHDLGFPLLSDSTGAVVRAWGADRGARVLRSAVLVGADLLVMDAWYGIRPRDTAVRAALAIPLE
jgi:peroxiredoxin Q/BCP